MVNSLGLIVVLVFVYSGYRKGLAAVIIGLAGLVFAYVASLKLAFPFGDILRLMGLAQGLSAYFMAATIIFMGVGFCFFIPGLLLKRRARKQVERGEARSWTFILAAILNGTVGLVYSLVVVWMAMFVRDALMPEQLEYSTRRPVFERMSIAAAKFIARRVVPDSEKNQAMVEFAADPGQVARHAKTVMNHPLLNQCLQDNAIRDAMTRGDTAAILESNAFKNLAQDPAFSEAGQALRLINDEGEAKGLAELLARVGSAFDQLQQDPEVRAILEDPEFNEQLRQSSPWKLLNDERMLTLIRRLNEVSPSSAELPHVEPNRVQPVPVETQKEKTPRKLYRWRDAQGGLHLTNDPPPEGAEEL